MTAEIVAPQQKVKTSPTTLIIMSSKSVNPTVRRLRELLGGMQVVDIYSDGVASVWGEQKSKLHVLKKTLLDRVITPLRLSASMSRYSQVICYFNPSGYLLGLINQLLPKSRRPHAVWVGFIPPPKLGGIKGWFKEKLTYLGAQGFDLVVCFTKPHHKSLELRFPKISSKLVYVRWWANSEELNQFDSGSEAGYIFCGGRTNRDFETFLTAVSQLNTPVKLVVGGGVKLPGLSDNVEVHRNIPFQEFYRLMGQASVVVIPLFDPEIPSGSDVLSQAMQMGRPVVVTNLSGMDDYVTDGHNAFLVKPHDPVDLREKLELLLADSNLRAQFREAGYDTVRKHNANTFAEELARVITQSAS